MIAATAPTEPVASAAGSAVVRVRDIAFSPRTVRVDRGGRVSWRFRDEYVTHNVHSVGARRFRSSRDKPYGSTYAATFRKAGTYRYVCTLHPGMKGRVVVRRAG